MYKFFVGCSLLLCVFSCDDGNIVTAELDFQDTFKSCEAYQVFYKIKDEPNESLSLQLNSTAIERIFDFLENDGTLLLDSISFTINESNSFYYRTFNAYPENYFCEDIPPAGINVTNEDASLSGTANITMALVEDDNDGIPAELEDLNDDGNLDNDDSDGDGIPNYLDEDDDGDNVLTRLEIDLENEDGDDNPLTNPKNTDNDNLPNYLDTDDDNDGVLTIEEENETQNQNPADDFTNPSIADYLNPEVQDATAATAYREHTIQQEFTISCTLENIELSQFTIIDPPYNFGTLEPKPTDERVVEIPF